MTCEEVGRILGLTARRVAIIEKQALKKLRKLLEEQGITAADLAPIESGTANAPQRATPGEDVPT